MADFLKNSVLEPLILDINGAKFSLYLWQAYLVLHVTFGLVIHYRQVIKTNRWNSYENSEKWRLFTKYDKEPSQAKNIDAYVMVMHFLVSLIFARTKFLKENLPGQWGEFYKRLIDTDYYAYQSLLMAFLRTSPILKPLPIKGAAEIIGWVNCYGKWDDVVFYNKEIAPFIVYQQEQ